MKFLVAVGILALVVLASTQSTQTPNCPEGVKEAVSDAFRTCRPPGGRRPLGGGGVPPPRDTFTSENKTRGFACIIDKFENNATLSEFVTACPVADNPVERDRFRCIMRKVGERCPDVGRRPGGRGPRPGGPRDGPNGRVTPRGEPELDVDKKSPEDDI